MAGVSVIKEASEVIRICSVRMSGMSAEIHNCKIAEFNFKVKIYQVI